MDIFWEFSELLFDFVQKKNTCNKRKLHGITLIR